MRTNTITYATLCIVVPVLFCTHSLAHERHFEGHPEWDHLWPDPTSLNDVGSGQTGSVLDLSGVWKGSPKAGNEHRYFFTPSGGGYGSGEDISFLRVDTFACLAIRGLQLTTATVLARQPRTGRRVLLLPVLLDRLTMSRA